MAQCGYNRWNLLLYGILNWTDVQQLNQLHGTLDPIATKHLICSEDKAQNGQNF
jgi:hypothetical protein